MGIITRTATAWFLAFSAIFPIVTYADDAGPGKEVRAIRHDLPIILDAQKPVRVTSVSIAGNAARVLYATAYGPMVGAMDRRLKRWWLDCAMPIAHDDTSPSCRTANASVAVPLPATAQGIVPHVAGLYWANVRMGQNDAPATSALENFSLRAPTEAESWLAPQGNSYCFFSATVQSATPIHVQAGTTIDVWFPFVLDPSLTYSLTIAHADAPIGPIDGTLRDNVVHFELPAFALAPNAELFGEIEGN